MHVDATSWAMSGGAGGLCDQCASSASGGIGYEENMAAGWHRQHHALMLILSRRLCCRQIGPFARSYYSSPVMEKRDYAAAVAALNTLQSNFAIVDAIRKSGVGMNKQAIPEMIEWCRRIGYEVCGSQSSALLKALIGSCSPANLTA